MSEAVLTPPVGHSPRPSLDEKTSPIGAIVFLVLLLGGGGFAAYSLLRDIGGAGEPLAIGGLRPLK